MGIAALVLGIISIICGIAGSIIGWLGIILGIVGIILGALGRKNAAQAGTATAGLVCSIIGTALSSLVYLACAVCVASIF
ncbi:MAG: hypothetical protein IJW18_02020 [Lachnospiraceae bacterium]|nr:hypothetical protein [Lachnospiraceae bacterium]